MFVFATLTIALFAVFRAQSLVIPDLEQVALGLDENAEATSDQVKRCSSKIAIIGSGITGAVAAFNVFEGFKRKSLPRDWPCITVFERNEVVGGRITETYVFDDPNIPINTCADTFSVFDTCIAEAAAEVGLTPLPEQLIRPQGGVGVWNGEEIVSPVDASGFRDPVVWTEFKRREWESRYGFYPSAYESRALEARIKFDQLLPTILLVPTIPGQPPRDIQPARNLRRAVEEAELTDLVQLEACSEEKWPIGLDRPGTISFHDEAIEAGIRERFFTDRLNGTNILEKYLSFEDTSITLVEGSNLRLIERLLKISGASVRLRTEVQEITTIPDANGDIQSWLTVAPAGGLRSYESFDSVIIATSLDRSNILFLTPPDEVPGLQQEYEDVVVTHIATINRLNSTYFNWTGNMPQNILTTKSSIGGESDRELPFFSLTYLGPVPGAIENIYKIVSRESIPDETIEQFLGPVKNTHGKTFSWINREILPMSVPVYKGTREEPICKPILEEIEILPEVYYAGAGEQILATAEFGCRMGKNAADLLVDSAR